MLVVSVEEAEATLESVDALRGIVAHGVEVPWGRPVDTHSVDLRLWVWEGQRCWEEGCEGQGDCFDCVHFEDVAVEIESDGR